MLRKPLLATAFVVATLAASATLPQTAKAQVFVSTPRLGVVVGTPYSNNGYYSNNSSYNAGAYYGQPYSNNVYHNGGYYNGGYRPAYNTYRPYGNYNNGYYNNGFYGRGYVGGRVIRR